MLTWIDRSTDAFPPLHTALLEPNGLLAAGGDLSCERLIAAYRHGCFPWYSDDQPLLWWSPDPRMVLLPNELHIPRSLKKTIHRQQYRVTYDQAFERVISACAAPRSTDTGTWITAEMQDAYCQLHARGYAHSVEVWHQEQLVGGLYGVAIGQLFFGESMFSRMSDASKVAFVTLVHDLRAAGFILIDCQMHTDHLARFGAKEISRDHFADYLQRGLDQPNSMHWTSP